MASARPVLGRRAHCHRRHRSDRGNSRAAWLAAPYSRSARARPDSADTQGGQGMAETTADVRRDIELTRERMSSTIDELERKLNVTQMVRDHPWPALALAVGAGVLLSGSRADVKAAAATAAATKGASSKIGT